MASFHPLFHKPGHVHPTPTHRRKGPSRDHYFYKSEARRETNPLAIDNPRQLHAVASRIENLDFDPYELRFRKNRDRRGNRVYTPVTRKPLFGDYRVPYNNRSYAFVKNWKLSTMPRTIAKLSRNLGYYKKEATQDLDHAEKYGYEKDHIYLRPV